MQKIISIWFISSIIITGLFSCDNNKVIIIKTETVFSSDTALHVKNDILYYHSVPFNGIVKENYANGLVKFVQRIKNGKQEALSETFYDDGKPESIRWYVHGEKDSVHRGWWQNGNKKYEYHFKNGSYNGMFTEWYQSGKILQQVMYANGNEVYGKGWRENGKPYMNFVMKNGRRYGLNNSNLCYTLNKETVIK